MSPLRADIAAAKENIFVPFTLGSNREMRKLVNYLQGNETVSYICPGKYEDNHGIMVVTSERVIFIKDTILEKTNQDFIFRSITSIEFIMGIVYGDIKLSSTSFKDVYIHHVPRNNGLAIVKLIRQGIRDNGLPLYDFSQPAPTAELASTPIAPTVPTTPTSGLNLPSATPVEPPVAAAPDSQPTSIPYHSLPVPTLGTPSSVPETSAPVSDPLAGLSATERQMILDSRASHHIIVDAPASAPVTSETSSSPSKEDLLADLQKRYDSGDIDANTFLKEKFSINKRS